LSSGIAKGGGPFDGVAGVSPASLSSRAAAGGTQKEKKEFLRGHPAPWQKALPSALPILKLLP